MTSSLVIVCFSLGHSSSPIMELLREQLMGVGGDNSPDAVMNIVRAVALPKEFGGGLRFASEGAGIKTATAVLSQVIPLSLWDSTVVANKEILATEMQLFLFSNPLRALVHYIHNQAGQLMNYIMQSADLTTTFTLPKGATTKIRPRLGNDGTAGVFAPHGPTVFPGFFQGEIYYPMNSTATWFVTLAPAPATVNGAILLYRWTGRQPQLVSVTAFVVAQAAYPIAITGGVGYYTSEIVNNDTATLTAALNLQTVGAVWAHRTVDDINTLATTVGGIRVNAASLKTSNLANIQDVNGNLVSCTMSSKVPWTQVAAGFNAITGQDGFRTRPAERGSYVFLVPDSDDDISEFWDDITQGTFVNSATPMFGYPLNERVPYKAICLSVPNGLGRAFSLEVTHCVEYLTNIKTVERDITTFTDDQMNLAIRILRTMETDYDNPVHFGDIMRTIGKYLPRAAQATAQILRAIGGEGPDAVANYLESNDSKITNFSKFLVNTHSDERYVGKRGKKLRR